MATYVIRFRETHVISHFQAVSDKDAARVANYLSKHMIALHKQAGTPAVKADFTMVRLTNSQIIWKPIREKSSKGGKRR